MRLTTFIQDSVTNATKGKPLGSGVEVLPQLVPNRVLQLDGDMLCYECGHNDDVPFAQCMDNFKAALQTRMAMAGAEYCNIHLTAASSGRLNPSLFMPLHLPALRMWAMESYAYTDTSQTDGNAHSVYHDTQKASQGIAQCQQSAIDQGAEHLSIIMSRDKEFSICSGLHCDWVTYNIKKVSTSSSWPSITEETKGNIALYVILGFVVIGVLATLEPVAAVGPAIWLVIWLCRKMKGCFAGKS